MSDSDQTIRVGFSVEPGAETVVCTPQPMTDEERRQAQQQRVVLRRLFPLTIQTNTKANTDLN